jgi:hypothetical protein
LLLAEAEAEALEEAVAEEAIVSIKLLINLILLYLHKTVILEAQQLQSRHKHIQ